ncbi:hypothetical protein GGR51DRAFT_575220 [Nemania sp. FL0031]|nr:hypothetical protein GGR51DRAFT_575220 [Nemania sp. FL0031]
MSIPVDKADTFARATVWSHGVNQYTPLDQDKLEGGTGISIDQSLTSDNVKDSDTWLNALENIQSSWKAHVTSNEIDEAVTFRHDALPASINKLLCVHSANSGPHGFANQSYENPEWGNPAEDEIQERIEQDGDDFIRDHGDELKEKLHKYPYHLWPVNTGGHWEVIFIVLEKTGNDPDTYSRVFGYAVVDPLVSGGKADDYSEVNARSKFINTRLNEIFQDSHSTTQRPNFFECERNIWVPKQSDNWSSGLRAIDFIWEILRRIQDMETSGLRNLESLFRPMRPYFNPEYVRLEAAGAIAARGLKTVDYQARIVLARVNGILPKIKEDTQPRDVRELMAPYPQPNIELIPQTFLDEGFGDIAKTLDALEFVPPLQDPDKESDK